MIKVSHVIGRSRTGDQLHRCHLIDREDGLAAVLSANAHCNQHLRLIPARNGVTIRMRPGLFCRKCFGDDAALIIGHHWHNATVVEA